MSALTNRLLIVIDMQRDFIDGSLGTPEAVSIVPNVVNKIDDAKWEIFYTKDTHNDRYSKTIEGQKLPVPHCMENTKGWEIYPDVSKAFDRYVEKGFAPYEFIKPTFGSVELMEAVKRLSNKTKFNEIEVIGLCTDICVISNVLMLKAYFPNKRIIVDAACCAGVTPESHENALNAMEMCHIDIENRGEEPWKTIV